MKLHLSYSCPVTNRRTFDTVDGNILSIDGAWVVVTPKTGPSLIFPASACLVITNQVPSSPQTPPTPPEPSQAPEPAFVGIGPAPKKVTKSGVGKNRT